MFQKYRLPSFTTSGVVLGAGVYGLVVKLEPVPTSLLVSSAPGGPPPLVACKILSLSQDSKQGISGESLREVQSLLLAPHPHLLSAREIFLEQESPEHEAFVQELTKIVTRLAVGADKDPESEERILLAAATAHLEHIRNLNNLFIITSLESENLADRLQKLRQEGKSAYSQKKQWMFEILLGLSFLHKHHLLHGDLKFENILVTQENKVKISDFGLSLLFDKLGLAARYGPLVTSSYRAPEVWAEEWFGTFVLVGPALDLWSFGMLCVQLFFGRRALYQLFPKLDEMKLHDFLANFHIPESWLMTAAGPPLRDEPSRVRFYKEFQVQQALVGGEKTAEQRAKKWLAKLQKLKPLADVSKDRAFVAERPRLTRLILLCVNFCADLRPSADECLRHSYFGTKLSRDMALAMNIQVTPALVLEKKLLAARKVFPNVAAYKLARAQLSRWFSALGLELLKSLAQREELLSAAQLTIPCSILSFAVQLFDRSQVHALTGWPGAKPRPLEPFELWYTCTFVSTKVLGYDQEIKTVVRAFAATPERKADKAEKQALLDLIHNEKQLLNLLNFRLLGGFPAYMDAVRSNLELTWQALDTIRATHVQPADLLT